MAAVTDALLVGVILLSLAMLGTSRLTACIRAAGLQGALLALLPLTIHPGPITLHGGLIALVSFALKGVLIPFLLQRAIREVATRREVEPFIGFSTSLFLGGLLVVTAFQISKGLPLPPEIRGSLLVPAALSTLLLGLLMLVSRTAALTQVIGYLVAENGIFVFGMSLTREVPLLIETGILLDVLVGVFIMGIVLYQINREFDHLDTHNLTTLRD